jgi:hypothetical protein
MALEQEPLEQAIERGDSTVRFHATAGEENGPYDPDHFSLVRGEELLRGQTMRVEGKLIWVGFDSPIQPGDIIVA